MPVYEYQCATCDNVFTKIVRDPDDRPDSPTCPECGAETTKRVISAPSVVLASSESDEVSEEAAREQAAQANQQDLNEALRQL